MGERHLSPSRSIDIATGLSHPSRQPFRGARIAGGRSPRGLGCLPQCLQIPSILPLSWRPRHVAPLPLFVRGVQRLLRSVTGGRRVHCLDSIAVIDPASRYRAQRRAPEVLLTLSASADRRRASADLKTEEHSKIAAHGSSMLNIQGRHAALAGDGI